MVYHGLLSKGCERCRQRKIRCDGGKPGCLKCQRSRVPCPGYRDLTDVIFRDESERVLAKVRKAETTARCHLQVNYHNPAAPLEYLKRYDLSGLSSAKSIISIHDRSQVESHDLGAAFFFNTYVSKEPPFYHAHYSWLTSIYSEQNSDGSLRAIIEAIGFAGLANVSSQDHLRRHAAKKYTYAVTSLKEALNSLDHAASDVTLMVVILLGLYQDVRFGDWSHYDAWNLHVQGATAVIEHRGRNNIFSECAAELYVQIRSQILEVCIMQRNPVPAPLVQLMYTFERSGIRRQWRTRRVASPASICEISFRLVNLHAACGPGRAAESREIYDAAFDIETDLQDWHRCLPSPWHYTTSEIPSNTTGTFGSTVHVYPSLWIAEALNSWRILRLLINQILIQHQYPSRCTDENQSSLSDSVIRQMSNEVCTSVASFEGSPRRMSLIKPLYLAAIEPRNTATLRSFAVERLRQIGSSMGIRQAELLAETASDGSHNWVSRVPFQVDSSFSV